jgi:ComF family protein
MVNEWLEIVQGLILPPCCVLCGAGGRRPTLDLCADCDADLPRNDPACSRCALPLCDGAAGSLAACAGCRQGVRSFDSAVAAFRYAFPVDDLVRRLKYHGELAHARVLATLLAGRISENGRGALPDAIVPVPLHPERYRERGFNQAFELARVIGRLLDLRVDDGLCRRARATQDQTQLGAAERRRNLRRAFALTRADAAVPRRVAIVDDVLTTGSTVEELARVLRDHGAETIVVWTVARAVATQPPAQPSNT